MKNIGTVILVAISFGLFTSVTHNQEILVENELIFEDWMAEPFVVEERLGEKPVVFEDWMAEPFVVKETI